MRELKAEFFPFCWLASHHEEQKAIKKKEPLAALAVRDSLDKKFIWTGVKYHGTKGEKKFLRFLIAFSVLG